MSDATAPMFAMFQPVATPSAQPAMTPRRLDVEVKEAVERPWTSGDGNGGGVPTILLVRHAQGSFGAADYDVLSPLGVSQAAALAGDLVRRGVRVDRVVSGSLARQRDTAAPIAEAAGCPVTVDPRWNEYDTDGILEHHSTSPVRAHRAPGSDAPEVSTREFQDLLEVALTSWIEAGDGGPSAEPWRAFAARAGAALDDVTAGLPPGTTAVVATSGGVLAATCVALLGLAPEAFIPFNRVMVNTGVTKLAHGRSATTLVSFNEHGHLERPGGSLVSYR
jgi:broad specificity phosphatase PhoE